MPAESACTNAEKVRGSVSYVDSRGRPATVDGATEVNVISGDATVARFDSAGDPLGAHEFYLVSGDAPGDSVFEVAADADLGAGIERITDIVTLHVTSEKAASFGFSFGTPEKK